MISRLSKGLAPILLAAAVALPHGRCQDAPPAEADPAGIVATRSVIVGVNGPRGGEKPARYFNVQGAESRGEKKFASFGVLEFPAEGRLTRILRGGDDAPKLTLVLTQSIPPFARPGRVSIWIATDPAMDVAALRFVEDRDGTIAAVAESCVRCGTWDFVVGETGRDDRIAVELPHEVGKAILKEDADRTVRLFVLPDAPGVAATWFGTDQPDTAHRPRLVID